MPKRAATTKKADPTPPKSAPSANLPFLKPEHINREGNTRIQILDRVRIWQGDYGTSIWLDVMMENKKKYTLSVNCNFQDRIALTNIAGQNLLDWPKQVIEVYQGKSKDGRKSYVNIFDAKRNAPDAAASQPPDDDVPF
jgi:hypothetical protein